MKLDVIKLDGGKAGSVELDEALFGLEPRADILHRVVRWQRNKAQAGTHKVLTKSEVSYSTKKIYRQKGTGGARHGSRGAPIFRHGGTYKGPTPRSHAHDLPKKFRKLGLRNIRASYSDGTEGLPEFAPYDAIITTAASEEIPRALLEQLSPDGGRLIIPLGGPDYQVLTLVTRQGDSYEQEDLDPVIFVPLLRGRA